MRVKMDADAQRNLDAAAHDCLEKISKDVLNDMRATCPVDSGALLADLDCEVQGTTARVGAASVDYAGFVENGTAPHSIFPHGDALYWEGANHPVASVNHPGTEATHFMRNALFRTRGA